MPTEDYDEITRLKAENSDLLAQNAVYRQQLEEMVKRTESVIAMLRAVSGSRIADLVEQYNLTADPKAP